jgi:TRAP-type mannitol/chloroaromatic compound transport system substrate-binding protein
MNTRRKLLLGTLATAGTLGGISKVVHAAPAKVVWRMGSSFPPALDTIHAGATRLSTLVKTLTNGEFQIDLLAAGEAGPPLAMLDAVQNGTVQCAHTAGYYYVNKNMALAFDTELPFGMNARQHNSWMYEGGGLELTRELYATFGVMNFPMGNTGAQMGGWFKKEIRTLDDMSGLKIRVPGIGGQVWKRMGAEPVALPGGEIVAAIKSGKIDAAEWTVPYDDDKLGLPEVAGHYYFPAWWEPSTQLSLLVGKKAWDALPEQYKAALSLASESVNQWMMAAYDARNPKVYKKIVGSGTRVHVFPNVLMINAHQNAFKIYDEEAAKNPSFKKIYESWKRFRGDITLWHGTAESAMQNFLSSWQTNVR